MFVFSVLQVRIVDDDGNVGHEGRVEIFYRESWRTVCSDGWDMRDANVLCKSLGYPGAEGDLDYESSGDWALDNVRCTGKEENIFVCDTRGLGVIGANDCSKSQDAGVRCTTDLPGMMCASVTI